MPRLKKDEELFDRLRSSGVRKGTARKVSESIRNSNRPASKAGRSAIADLTRAVAEIQDRVKRGPQERRATKRAGSNPGEGAQRRSETAGKTVRTRAKAQH